MDSLGPQKEFDALLAERDFLRGRLGELATERDNCTQIEARNLVALYYKEIGCIEVDCLRVEMACARVKREIEFITAALNRGGLWDYEEITRALDKEFAEWQQRIAAETTKLEAAQRRLAALMSPEDHTRFQKLYRKLVKELHPDIHPARHPRLAPLWDRLQRAHCNGDIAEFELIGILLRDEQAEAPPSSLDVLRKEIGGLKTSVEGLLKALFDLRRAYPFTLADLLNDSALIEDRKKSLSDKLRALSAREVALRDQLNELMDGASP
jgi:hypothetical protein